MNTPNPSRERFDSLTHLIEREDVNALVAALREANSRPVSYTHPMFSKDRDLAQCICYFVNEDPSETSAEVRFAPFGILDSKGLGCVGWEARDIGEFLLVILPSQLPTLGLPMLGWDRQVVKAFKFNTADSDEQWAKEKSGYRTKFQPGLVSRDAHAAGGAYSSVIYRVDDK